MTALSAATAGPLKLITDFSREPGFWTEFETTAGQWLEIDLPFADFVPKFRGNELDVTPPNPAHIRGLGLMIADGKDGAFAIVVDSVQAYRDGKPFSR
jgi:hypothetical protein